MIEIIYNESGKTGNSVVVKPPKNIRQIGSPRGRHKIYVEDYVNTFLHAQSAHEKNQDEADDFVRQAAVLLGKSEVSKDIRYTFISGAVNCVNMVFDTEGIRLDEHCWEYIYKEIKQYFDNQEVVGWCLSLPGETSRITPAIESAHRKYFSGRDKVILIVDRTEEEECFYVNEQGAMQKQEGYYIYYEKNLPMQEYMVSRREKEREETSGFAVDESDEIAETYESYERERSGDAESAIRSYRSTLMGKQRRARGKNGRSLLYLAASAAMVVLCVIGITTMNNYEKMKQVEQTLTTMAGIDAGKQAGEVQAEEPIGTAGQQEDMVKVESVPGFVTEDGQPEPTGQPEAEESAAQQNQENQQGAEGQQEEQSQQEEGDQGMEGHPEGGDQQPEEQEETEDQQDDQTAAMTQAQIYLEQGFYIVQPGDRLEIICKNIYQTTAIMDKLCEVNGITDGDKIFAGQKLILP